MDKGKQMKLSRRINAFCPSLNDDGSEPIEFDYIWKDTVVAHVWADPNTDTVRQEVYGDNLLDTPIPGDNLNMRGLLKFFESRCFPKERGNALELLNALGLKDYNPYNICLKTRGRLWDDYYWIRFKGDTATFDEIKLRD